MTLLPDWKAVLKKAWSVKSNFALAALGITQVVFSIYGEPVLGAVLSGAVMTMFGSATILLRVMAQKEAEDLVGTKDASSQ